MANSIDSSLYLSNYQKEQRKTGSNILGKDDFLKILMVQLQNQDPSNPMDDKEFIAQMATFSTLEQITNMNQTMQKLADSQQQNLLIAYSDLIGKEVTWTHVSNPENEGDEPIVEEGIGKVVSTSYKNGQVFLTLENGKVIEPANISEVRNPPENTEKPKV